MSGERGKKGMPVPVMGCGMKSDARRRAEQRGIEVSLFAVLVLWIWIKD